MKLSPQNIRQQEFAKKMRGYDPEEVKTFLDGLAERIENINQENEFLKSEVESLTSQVNSFKKIEQEIQETLIQTKELTTKSLEAAKNQAGMLVKEAELKALQMIDNARESTTDIRNAVVVLREEKNLIISKLKAIVGSQANLLNQKVARAGDELANTDEPNKIDIDINDVLNKIL
jgi:cell division initiation protein